MLVVPIHGDEITTVDGADKVVSAYTNLKDEGPAVYVDSSYEDEGPEVIYFFDISHLNGVKVKFVHGQNVLKALGHLTRKVHLPQPHDTIVIQGEEPDTTEEVEVSGLKLHSKSIGLSKGLLVLDDEKHKYDLRDIHDVKPAVGGDDFNRKLFLKLYADYLGS